MTERGRRTLPRVLRHVGHLEQQVVVMGQTLKDKAKSLKEAEAKVAELEAAGQKRDAGQRERLQDARVTRDKALQAMETAKKNERLAKERVAAANAKSEREKAAAQASSRALAASQRELSRVYEEATESKAQLHAANAELALTKELRTHEREQAERLDAQNRMATEHAEEQAKLARHLADQNQELREQQEKLEREVHFLQKAKRAEQDVDFDPDPFKGLFPKKLKLLSPEEAKEEDAAMPDTQWTQCSVKEEVEELDLTQRTLFCEFDQMQDLQEFDLTQTKTEEMDWYPPTQEEKDGDERPQEKKEEMDGYPPTQEVTEGGELPQETKEEVEVTQEKKEEAIQGEDAPVKSEPRTDAESDGQESGTGKGNATGRKCSKRAQNIIAKEERWEAFQHPHMRRKYVDEGGEGHIVCAECGHDLKMLRQNPKRFLDHCANYCKVLRQSRKAATGGMAPTVANFFPRVVKNDTKNESAYIPATIPKAPAPVRLCDGVYVFDAHRLAGIPEPLMTLFAKEVEAKKLDATVEAVSKVVGTYLEFEKAADGTRTVAGKLSFHCAVKCHPDAPTRFMQVTVEKFHWGW